MNIKATLQDNIQTYIKNAYPNASDYLSTLITNGNMLDRTIGESQSYESFLTYINNLGEIPFNVFSRSYPYIYDHLKRNIENEIKVNNGLYQWPMFTYYNGTPNIVLSDPDTDTYSGYYKPDYIFSQEMSEGVEIKYSESANGTNQNKSVDWRDEHKGDAHGIVSSFNANPQYLSKNDLIKKTNDMFTMGQMKTLVARFHTDSEETKDRSNPTQTAISTKYGMSHGRNLLSGYDPDNNNYDNPYCRTWTYHHQYKDFARDIRPFVRPDRNDNENNTVPETQYNLYNGYDWKYFGNNDPSESSDQANHFGGKGRERLDTFGVLNPVTNRPNIVPITERGKNSESFLREKKSIVNVKNCMFSIENLAWKTHGRLNYFDVNGLSDEQKGPMGGRIMWFPPYNLSFDEALHADWEETNFIGRGEPLYTYKNATRTGTLRFTMLIDHPAILDYWTGWEKNGQKHNGKHVQSLNVGGVDNTDNQEQTLLRFFAGCDILEAAPQKYKKPKIKPPVEEEKKKNPNIDPNTPSEQIEKKMCVMVFYPNNYSGKDDAPTVPSATVNAVDYLINGFGSQRASKFPSDSSMLTFTNMGDPVDVPVEMKPIYKTQSPPDITSLDCPFGYEITTPVNDYCETQSTTDASQFTNYITLDGKKTYDDKTLNISSNACRYSYDNSTWYLPYKYLGSMVKSDKRYKSNGKANNEWYLHRWYYRVDEETSDQELRGFPHNYIDGKSYGLNAFNCVDAQEYFMNPNGITQVSLADAYQGFNDNDEISNLLSTCTTPDNVAFANSVMNQTNGIKLVRIDVYGHASVHGRKQVYNEQTKQTENLGEVDETRKNALADGRATTLGKWLQSFPAFKDKVHIHLGDYEGVLRTDNEEAETESHKTPDVDDKKQKIYRSAVAIFTYTETHLKIKLQEDGFKDVLNIHNESEKLANAPYTVDDYRKAKMSEHGYSVFFEMGLYKCLPEDIIEESRLDEYYEEMAELSEMENFKEFYPIETFYEDVNVYYDSLDYGEYINQDSSRLSQCAESFVSTYYETFPNWTLANQEELLNALASFADLRYEISREKYEEWYDFVFGYIQNQVKFVYKFLVGEFNTVVGDSLEDTEVQSANDAYQYVIDNNGTQLQASLASSMARKKKTKNSEQWYDSDRDANEWADMPRYDGEGEFFKLLEFHDPHTFNLVSQKVRYFDPAYHSISPEGFAARLTFLNQCTRQGCTIGASDQQGVTATNLAFGAPPVCVLRIGDFYYTRIIIENIQIKYDNNGLNWDLNPEGIGVMPMMADIDISFKFIGGSDLGGPVSRLQNAMSFNYYANTSVYDNRAEEVAYDSNGNLQYFKPFIPEQTTDDKYE